MTEQNPREQFSYFANTKDTAQCGSGGAMLEPYNNMGDQLDEAMQKNRELQNRLDILTKANTEIGILFGKIEEVVFSIDLEGKQQIQMSAACEKIYGLPQSAFQSNMDLWFEMILPEDRHIIEASYAMLHKGEPFVNTYRISDAKGKIKWLETKLFPTVAPDGNPIRLDGITSDITERKEAESTLLHSETQYRELFDINPLPMWIREDGTFRFLRVNLAAVKHYGYTEEEFLSMTLMDIRPENEQKRLIELGGSGSLTGQYAGIWTHTKKNGAEIMVEIISNPIIYEGKNARLVLARDITKKLHRERALKEAEQNLSTILENTETAYVLMDKDCRIVSYNHVAAALVPVTARRLSYRGVYYPDLLPKERQAAIIEKMEIVLSGGKKMKYEIKNYVMEHTVWFDISLSPIRNENDEVAGLMLAITDITSRKLTELRLEQSNERFRFATKATNDAIWEWDFASDTIQWGEGYEKLFGYSQEANEGSHSWSNRIHPEDVKRVISTIKEQAASSNKSLWQDEYRYLKADGSIAYVYDRGYIIYDDQKKAVKMVGAMHDISARKQAELEREKITADLLQRNKELEQFTYIVSHNLRAPLANIKGLTNTLADGSLTESDRSTMLSMLAVSSNSLDDIVLDLNNILRIGKNINEKKETVRFSQLVEDIYNSLGHSIKTESVELKTDFTNCAEVFTIKSYMHSILYNLISNSIKYRRSEVPAIITIASTRNDREATLVLRDNGLGIDLTRNHDKVFGLYKRFHLNIEGKGLGLFMVKTQVEALGGTILLESMPNMGTTFTITLPL